MRDDKNEIHWDKTLRIRTTGRDDSRADQFRYPYEPTPYSVLERLANTGLIRKENVLLDYGCGKGRVGFFLSRQTRCRAIGIEYDERIWQKAEENRNSGSFVDKVSFVCMDAREFDVPVDVDRIYFFNPFSVEILQRVLARIRDSYYESMREILLFFYYPSEEYVSCLMEEDELMFYDEIDCRDLFPGEDHRERILMFEFPGIEE